MHPAPQHLADGDRSHTHVTPRGHLRADPRTPIVVDTDDRVITPPLTREDSGLDRRIVLHGPMPVEMIRRDVEQHGHVRVQRRRQVDLEGRQLEHIGPRRRRRRQVQHRLADIATDFRIEAKLLQHVANQGRGRRLAVGAGDADDARLLASLRRADRAEEQLDIADHFAARLARLEHKRVRAWMCQRHPGAEHQRRHIAPVDACKIAHAHAGSLCRRPRRRLVVPAKHFGPAGRKRKCRRDARARKPEDRDGLPAIAVDLDHGVTGS